MILVTLQKMKHNRIQCHCWTMPWIGRRRLAF